MGSERRESVIGEVTEGFLGRTGGRESKQKRIKDEQHVGRPWSHGNECGNGGSEMLYDMPEATLEPVSSNICF